MKSPLGPILGIVLAAVLAAGLPTEAAGKSPDARLCTLPVNSIRAVREYFRYRGPSDMPIVSGHRGCREDGCPENSIRAFEHTLRRVPAFFEIDPRMTRDSVVVLMHDPTLDRTTTGHGPVSEHTWAELRELRLKDVHGNVTDERIPTLEEAIRWSAGKTVVNLDVYTPKEVLGPLLERLGFPPHVMLTIHTPEQAEYYYALSRKTMFSIHIKSLEQLEAFEKTPIDWRNVMAYVGPRMLPENREAEGQGRPLHDLAGADLRPQGNARTAPGGLSERPGHPAGRDRVGLPDRADPRAAKPPRRRTSLTTRAGLPLSPSPPRTACLRHETAGTESAKRSPGACSLKRSDGMLRCDERHRPPRTETAPGLSVRLKTAGKDS